VELGRAHPHLANGVHAPHPLQRRLPARRRDVLLDDVLGRRRLLRVDRSIHHSSKEPIESGSGRTYARA
jgi:hypothetical protein